MSLRFSASLQTPTLGWERLPIAPRSATKLGFSFRLPQAELMGLNPPHALETLLGRGFDLVRLAGLWNRLEVGPGAFDWSSLDWQIEAASRHGRRMIVAVGPVKNFGYPESYVPRHHLPVPLLEGSLISRDSHPRLAEAALAFLTSLIERYRDLAAIAAWQVEHEAVDPLGLEHSWRLARSFVAEEVDLVHRLDPGRPVILNGFLPMSRPVMMVQRWRTRGQGDSLALATARADLVGLDVYPCHAVARLGPMSLYLGASDRAVASRVRGAVARCRQHGRPVLVTEGQAEPWEQATNPPNRPGLVAASCPPERAIETYNLCLTSGRGAGAPLWAYLFWGAEYWLLRELSGDSTYMAALGRVLEGS